MSQDFDDFFLVRFVIIGMEESRFINLFYSNCSYVLIKTDVFNESVCALSLVGMTKSEADNETYTEMFYKDGGTSKIPSGKNN